LNTLLSLAAVGVRLVLMQLAALAVGLAVY
jgi:hypothetical protein